MPDTASVSIEVEPSPAMQALVDEVKSVTGADEGGGGGGRKNMAGRIGKMGKAGTKMVQAGLKKAGVSFSLASMLKQSQIFTGFLGSLFQILGAFIDVLLAPLIPILMPLLVFLGRMIPVIAKLAQIVLGPIVFVIGLFQKLSLWILDGVMHVLNKYFDNIIEKVANVVDRFKTAWEYLKNGEIWEATKEMLGALWDMWSAPLTIAWDTFIGTVEDVWEWLSGFQLIQDMTTAFNTWYDNTISPFFDSVKEGWDSFMDSISGWYNSSIQYLVDAWDWLTNFDLVGGLAEWWNDLWSNTFKPWIASLWNPMVDFLQDILNWAADAMSNIKIMGQQITGSLTAPNLSGMRMGESDTTPPKLPPGAYDVPLPPGYPNHLPPANVTLHLSGMEPQQKVEVEVADKRVAVTDLGMQMSNI